MLLFQFGRFWIIHLRFPHLWSRLFFSLVLGSVLIIATISCCWCGCHHRLLLPRIHSICCGADRCVDAVPTLAVIVIDVVARWFHHGRAGREGGSAVSGRRNDVRGRHQGQNSRRRLGTRPAARLDQGIACHRYAIAAVEETIALSSITSHLNETIS